MPSGFAFGKDGPCRVLEPEKVLDEDTNYELRTLEEPGNAPTINYAPWKNVFFGTFVPL